MQEKLEKVLRETAKNGWEKSHLSQYTPIYSTRPLCHASLPHYFVFLLHFLIKNRF